MKNWIAAACVAIACTASSAQATTNLDGIAGVVVYMDQCKNHGPELTSSQLATAKLAALALGVDIDDPATQIKVAVRAKVIQDYAKRIGVRSFCQKAWQSLKEL